MVGVPGRSKACHTCRHRRIKCGGELPTCLNCAKSRRVCTGYRRQHAFILSNTMVSDGPNTSQQSQSPALARDDDGSGTVMISRWRADQNKLRDKSLMSDVLATSLSNLPQQVSPRNVFRDRFFSLMIDNDFPCGNSAYLTLGDRSDWLLHILNLPSLTPALENAFLAVCTARLGRFAARPALVHESLGLYTRGVSQVRRNILDKSLQKDDQSLAACLSLLWYEVMECPGGTLDGYRAHYRGCLELLQMRGAAAHTSGLAHTTLQILRLHAVVMGNSQQAPSFLISPDWLDIPWSSKPDGKSPLDRVIDILLDMPNYRSQVQALTNVTDPRQILHGAAKTLREGKKTEHSLEKWFEAFQAAIPGVLYHVELSTLDSVVDGDEQGKPFPVAYRFPAFIVGRTMVYYWLALLNVQAPIYFAYEALVRLVTILESMGRENLPCTCSGEPEGANRCLRHFSLHLVPGFAHGNHWPRSAAVSICQSVEYFLQDTMRGFGPASVLPALSWVKGFLNHAPGCWDREMQWIDDMVRRIHESGHSIAGATLGRNLESMSLVTM